VRATKRKRKKRDHVRSQEGERERTTQAQQGRTNRSKNKQTNKQTKHEQTNKNKPQSNKQTAIKQSQMFANETTPNQHTNIRERNKIKQTQPQQQPSFSPTSLFQGLGEILNHLAWIGFRERTRALNASAGQRTHLAQCVLTTQLKQPRLTTR
jgi:hypothetical protein